MLIAELIAYGRINILQISLSLQIDANLAVNPILLGSGIAKMLMQIIKVKL